MSAQRGSSRSPMILAPEDAAWARDWQFDQDEKWDDAIRGRPTPVAPGTTVNLLRSLLRKRSDDPVQRTVRLSVRAVNHPLVFTVRSTLDSEVFEYELPVGADNAQSVSFACDLFLLQVRHADAAGVPAVAHFRVDDKDAAASLWHRNEIVTGIAAIGGGPAEQIVPIPPFAQEFDVYGTIAAGSALRYYTAQAILPAALYFTKIVAVPMDGPFRVNQHGITTFQPPVGTRWGFMFRCVG